MKSLSASFLAISSLSPALCFSFTCSLSFPESGTAGLAGGFAGSDWGTDVAMEADGENVWKGEAELKAGDEFKVRADGAWDNSWGVDGFNGANLVCEADGTYVITITFDADGNGVVEAVAK